MRNVLDCINVFVPLLSTEYELVLGRKGVAVTLRFLFDNKDCFHLMGLQYLADRPELRRDRRKVFDEIADGIIPVEKIESSDFYYKIEQRVHFLPLLEQMIDSNDTVFKYNKKVNISYPCFGEGKMYMPDAAKMVAIFLNAITVGMISYARNNARKKYFVMSVKIENGQN